MRIKINSLVLALILFLSGYAFTQQKPRDPLQQKKSAPSGASHKSTQGKQTGSKQNNPTTKEQRKPVVTEFTPEQIDNFKTQCSSLVKFFEGTLNFLSDPSNPVKEKQTIITDSYLKFFMDDKVQIEDDLDEKRLVPLYKDIPAYLSDVNFFFKSAAFLYTVQDVNVMKNDIGQTYFKVTANRNLKGITVNRDSVNSNKVRYFEINYDDSKQELKIVSIYTTKLNERDDMRNWWNALAPEWKMVFGKDRIVENDINLSQIETYNDTSAIVSGNRVALDPGKFYPVVLQAIMMKNVEVPGNSGISDISPLAKLSSLTSVSLANTGVTDLNPLRNLNQLEDLDISGTKITSLEPIRYTLHLRSLKMKQTRVKDLNSLSSLPSLEILDFSGNNIDSLEPLADLMSIKDLRFSETPVNDLKPVSGLTKLEVLYFSRTPVVDISPLSNLTNLTLVIFDNTPVKSLGVFENLPSVRKIFCDSTMVDPDEALKFMLKHPSVDLIFESDALNTWWKGMTPEWIKVFNLYRKLDETPTAEQLHHLITLDSLDISGRAAITTLDPVSRLSILRVMECANTGISSLDPLKELSDLSRINATNTKITSVQALSNLKELTVLSIEHTGVSEISSLKDLKELKTIYADNTGINQVKANAFMDENQGCLVICETYENTQWWSQLPEAWKDDLTRYFKFTGTPDKNQLQKIAGTEKLVINEDPNIISLQPVTDLSRLKELEVTDTRIASLEPLTRLTRLQSLRISKNPVTKLNPISGLNKLKELDFSNTQVEDLEPIQNMTSLETLRFNGTPVKNLKYLQNLKRLKVIEFYNTKVGNLDVLETLPELKSLKIFNTRISEKRVAKFKQAHPGVEVVYY